MQACLDGAGRRRRADMDLAMWAAWHVAALSRAKRMPKVETLLSTRPARRRQSPQQQGAMLMVMTRAFGGEVSPAIKAKLIGEPA